MMTTTICFAPPGAAEHDDHHLARISELKRFFAEPERTTL